MHYQILYHDAFICPLLFLLRIRHRYIISVLETFSSPEASFHLVSTKNRDLGNRHQKPAIYGLPVKSDWLGIQNKYSAHAEASRDF